MLISVLAGALLGYLAGIGIGGGSLLIMFLTLGLNMPQADARAINLMFFIVSAGAVTYCRRKKGELRLGKILPAILAGCACAAIFSWIGFLIDVEKLKKAFGILLLVTGLRELFYRPRKLR